MDSNASGILQIYALQKNWKKMDNISYKKILANGLGPLGAQERCFTPEGKQCPTFVWVAMQEEYYKVIHSRRTGK
jgi:hypothetical protein